MIRCLTFCASNNRLPGFVSFLIWALKMTSVCKASNCVSIFTRGTKRAELMDRMELCRECFPQRAPMPKVNGRIGRACTDTNVIIHQLWLKGSTKELYHLNSSRKELLRRINRVRHMTKKNTSSLHMMEVKQSTGGRVWISMNTHTEPALSASGSFH